MEDLSTTIEVTVTDKKAFIRIFFNADPWDEGEKATLCNLITLSPAMFTLEATLTSKKGIPIEDVQELLELARKVRNHWQESRYNPLSTIQGAISETPFYTPVILHTICFTNTGVGVNHYGDMRYDRARLNRIVADLIQPFFKEGEA